MFNDYDFISQWENMVEFGVATEEELGMAVALCGSSVETLDRVMFIKTGYRSWEQFTECELSEEE